MNKRIRLKQEKINNLARQNDILNEISKEFTISEKEFGNGYFIYDIGGNAVCHFSLKETPEWKYGIWLLKNNKFTIFGEHIELIDKFKPNACYIKHENHIDEFIKEVKNIASNSKLYFVDSLTYGEALVDFKEDGNGNYKGYQVKSVYNEVTGMWDMVTRDTNITQEQFVEKEYNEFMERKKERLYDD